MLGQLQAGGGYQSSVDICGIFHMKHPWSSKTYHRAEEQLAQESIDQSEEILDLNRKERQNYRHGLTVLQILSAALTMVGSSVEVAMYTIQYQGMETWLVPEQKW